MKMNGEQEAQKMEAYLKFYAEYLSCKNSKQIISSAGQKARFIRNAVPHGRSKQR